MTIIPSLDLAGLAGDGRIATGDVRAVPVGIYAKSALQKLGLWASVEPKLAMLGNVRAALVLVARVEPAVKILATFPDDSHEPIVYPVAATVGAKPEATLYLTFLRSAGARSIFERYGFSVLIKPVS